MKIIIRITIVSFILLTFLVNISFNLTDLQRGVITVLLGISAIATYFMEDSIIYAFRKNKIPTNTNTLINYPYFTSIFTPLDNYCILHVSEHEQVKFDSNTLVIVKKGNLNDYKRFKQITGVSINDFTISNGFTSVLINNKYILYNSKYVLVVYMNRNVSELHYRFY